MRGRAMGFGGALVLGVEGALVEALVYLGVAEGALAVVVVVVVELGVDAQAAELGGRGAFALREAAPFGALLLDLLCRLPEKQIGRDRSAENADENRQ